MTSSHGKKDMERFLLVRPCLTKPINYVKNQSNHHKTMSFQDEYKSFLKAYGIQYDERYVFDDWHSVVPSALWWFYNLFFAGVPCFALHRLPGNCRPFRTFWVENWKLLSAIGYQLSAFSIVGTWLVASFFVFNETPQGWRLYWTLTLNSELWLGVLVSRWLGDFKKSYPKSVVCCLLSVDLKKVQKPTP